MEEAKRKQGGLELSRLQASVDVLLAGVDDVSELSENDELTLPVVFMFMVVELFSIRSSGSIQITCFLAKAG